MTALDTDPRLRLVPLGARMLWLALARASGPALRATASDVPQLARIARATPADVQGNLHHLVRVGLVECGEAVS